MKRFAVYALLFAIILLPATRIAAKDEPPRWKAVQVKHFTAVPGTGISKSELESFYEGFLKQLRRIKVAERVLEEGEAVSPEEAANSLIVEGTFTSYEPVHFPHNGHSDYEYAIYRLSDHQLLMKDTRHSSGISGNDWNGYGYWEIYEIMKRARNLSPSATFPSASLATPANAATLAASTPPPANAETLTNASVLEMVADKIPEAVIIIKIQNFPNNFDLSNSALAELTQKGVSPAIMNSMLTAPMHFPTPAPPKPATGANAEPSGPSIPHHALPYRAAEVKNFTIAEGVEFPPKNMDPQIYLDALDEEFLAEVQKQGIATLVVRHGETLPEGNAADALLIEAQVADFQKNSRNMVHPPELTVQIHVYRRGDHALVAIITRKTQILYDTCVRPKLFAKDVSLWTAREIKKAM
jgi:hypothetical protein